MTRPDDLSPLEASSGEEVPLAHDPPPPPGWEDPLEDARLLDDPASVLAARPETD